MAESDEFQADFESAEEELDYWRSQAHHYRGVFRGLEVEMKEFSESSKELEVELQNMLEKYEADIKDLRQNNMKLNLDRESLQEKLEKIHEDSYVRITDLENQLETANAENARNIQYIREIENKNDNLERTNRTTIATVNDFEQQLNDELERNAFLENEVEEKKEMIVTIQRLRDEARDLSHDLTARQRKEPGESRSEQSTPVKPSNLSVLTRQPSTSSPTVVRTMSNLSQPTTPTREQNTQNGSIISNASTTKGTPLTPSARVSALNIVGELLRKVGALETKLSSCKNFVRETPQKNSKPTTSHAESPAWDRQNGRSGNGSTMSGKNTSMKISV